MVQVILLWRIDQIIVAIFSVTIIVLSIIGSVSVLRKFWSKKQLLGLLLITIGFSLVISINIVSNAVWYVFYVKIALLLVAALLLLGGYRLFFAPCFDKRS